MVKKKYTKSTIKWLIYISAVCIIIIVVGVFYIQNVLPVQILKSMYNTIGHHNPSLQDLIAYCKDHIPYYSNMNSEQINVVDKKIIRKNYKSFFTRGKFEKRMEWTVDSTGNSWTQLEGVQKKRQMTIIGALRTFIGLLMGGSVAQVTGGSSGEYYYQWYDLNDLWWGGYSFVRGWQKMGWNPREKILVYYFHGANSIKMLEYGNFSSFIPIYFNVQVPKFTSKNDICDSSVLEFINKINKEKPELIVSFPNVIFRVCQKMHEQNIKLSYVPKYMDLSADFLFTCQYNFIKSIFINTDIRLSYGTIEFGQIAQQVPGEMFIYEVYPDVAFVENDENDNLIVSAFNYKTLPLLRYKTDDKGKVNNQGRCQYILNLVGKQNGSVDYLKLDKVINRLQQYARNSIINVRINENNNTLILTTLETIDQNITYFDRYLQGWHVMVDVCKKGKCATKDTYNRKVTPILKEYDFT